MVQTRTRTGRQIKKPERYTPEETVLEDDYTHDEYDSDDIGSDLNTEDEIYSDEESARIEEEFVVPDMGG